MLWFSACLAFFLVPQAYADTAEGDTPDFPVIISDEGEQIAAKADFDLFEYLNISTTFGGSAGSTINRQFSYARIGGQYSSGIFSVFGNYLTTRVASDLDLVLADEVAEDKRRCRTDAAHRAINNDCADLLRLPDEVLFEFRYNESGLDELYAKATLYDNLELTFGNNRITWGQFAFLSPVHTLLPINTEQQIGFSKVDARIPQPVLQLHYYPREDLLLDFSYIFETRLSPEQEEVFNLFFRGDLDDEDNDFRSDYAPGYDASLNGRDQFASHEQFSLRAIYQPRWGVLGLTWWNGPLHFFIPDNATIHCGRIGQHFCDLGAEPQPGQAPAIADDYFRTIAPDLDRLTAVAFEGSINLNNWTLIGEWVHIADSSDSLDTTGILNSAIAVCGNSGATADTECESNRRVALSFVDRLARVNNGRSRFDSTFNIFAVGADGSSSDGSWVYNLELVGLSFDRPSEYDALVAGLDLSFDEELQEELVDQDDMFIIPTLHVAKSHTFMGKPANWGVAFGFFLQFGGLLGYYNIEVTENFTAQFALELIQRATETGAALTDYADYDLKSQASEAASIALRFDF